MDCQSCTDEYYCDPCWEALPHVVVERRYQAARDLQVAMRFLSACLRDAAAMQTAFECGANWRAHDVITGLLSMPNEMWRPGCSRPAPGWGER